MRNEKNQHQHHKNEINSGKISKEDIQLLDLIQFEGPIHLIKTASELNDVLGILEAEKLVGLDTEKRPTFRKGDYHPISLVQLATLNDAYLILLQKTGMTSQFKAFLANAKINKVGIALRDDIKDLQKIAPFLPDGIIHLDQLAREKGIVQTGARSLTAKFLGKRLSKACQKSNWANAILTDKQKIYAATDAWICLKLYPFLCLNDDLDS